MKEGNEESDENSPNHERTSTSKRSKLTRHVFCFIGVAYLVYFCFNFNDFQNGLSNFMYNFGCHRTPTKPLEQHPIFRNLINILDTSGTEEEGTTKSKEIISVTNPFVPNPRYGKPVYSAKLLHHKFGNSWGKPAVVNFTVPSDISFEAVVLTLHTEVDGVQFDRLANLFVDGVQVWRTSTIEPGGRTTFSDFKKISVNTQAFQEG